MESFVLTYGLRKFFTISNLKGQKMAVSTTTRTHLIYQFIILTLLFLSIGYNELLPDRKFILFLAFVPIFCYQLVILSCCMELMPVPRWMGFLGSANEKCDPDAEELKCNSEISSLTSTSASSQTQIQEELTFPDASEIPCQRRWEKSVTNLGVSPKYFACPQKSKSWMSLNDSKSTERLLSREGSFDVLASLCDRKCTSRIINKSDKTNREERAVKAKSWKPFGTNFETSEKAEMAKSTSMESAEPFSNSGIEVPQEESELSKSYSFPFRQKRLETWLEMKETSLGESNQSLDMPYWQTVGYNLAVKYEARRRRIAASNPTKSELPCEDAVHTTQKHEVSTCPAHTDKHNSKKCAKSASACINKIKAGFSNLIAKKKDELPENSNNCNTNRISKSNLLLKLKNKNISFSTKEKERSADIPESLQLLSNDRPLIFYPKYLPFEKERFEGDVNKKMKELDEQKTNCNA